MGRKPRRLLADPKKAIAYVRVSTDRERQELGAEAQKRAIRAWATHNRIAVVAWFIEEVSGAAQLDKRPVLLDAVAAVSAEHAGILVVHRLDRFARNTTTATVVGLELAKAGAKLVTANGEGNGDDPASKMMRGILLEVAEYERAIIAARIRAALAVKKARGEMTGRPPYGWRVGADKKRLEPDPREQTILREAKRLRGRGVPLRGIIDSLGENGMLSRANKPFTVAAMHAMVREWI